MNISDKKEACLSYTLKDDAIGEIIEKFESNETTDEELIPSEPNGFGGQCTCGGHNDKRHLQEENQHCQVCDNLTDLQGHGVGNCKCS